MAFDPTHLTIGYAGRLLGYNPNIKRGKFKKWLRDWFWMFQTEVIDQTTRSGYYLLKGLGNLKARNPELAERIHLQFWGDIDAIHAAQALEFGVAEQLSIEGFCSNAETLEKLAKCDLLFLPLESAQNGNEPLFIPGKLFEYLTLEKPILALTGPSDCREILEKSGMAVLCDPSDAGKISATLEKIVRAQEELVNHPDELSSNLLASLKPNKQFISQYDFRNIVPRFEAIFEEMNLLGNQSRNA